MNRDLDDRHQDERQKQLTFSLNQTDPFFFELGLKQILNKMGEQFQSPASMHQSIVPSARTPVIQCPRCGGKGTQLPPSSPFLCGQCGLPLRPTQVHSTFDARPRRGPNPRHRKVNVRIDSSMTDVPRLSLSINKPQLFVRPLFLATALFVLLLDLL